MYFSSIFPYVVLFCFLVRGLLLDGASEGIAYMFYPKVRRDNVALSREILLCLCVSRILLKSLLLSLLVPLSSWKFWQTFRCGGRLQHRSSLLWVSALALLLLTLPTTLRATTATVMPSQSQPSTSSHQCSPLLWCSLCSASAPKRRSRNASAGIFSQKTPLCKQNNEIIVCVVKIVVVLWH